MRIWLGKIRGGKLKNPVAAKEENRMFQNRVVNGRSGQTP
jgi:hypothetical protein